MIADGKLSLEFYLPAVYPKARCFRSSGNESPDRERSGLISISMISVSSKRLPGKDLH